MWPAVVRTVLAAPAAALVCVPGASAAAAPPSTPAPAFSFLRNYTDQLGVPGFQGGTGVTPQSDLYTGFAELSLRVGGGGRSLPSDGRRLDQDRYPILHTTRTEGGVVYALTVFAAPVGSQQVNFARIEAVNPDAKRSRAARVIAFIRNAGLPIVTHPGGRTYRSYRFGRPATPARPGLYFQPGLEFSPLSVYAFAGEALLRDGTVLYDAHAVEPAAQRSRSLRVDAGPIDRQTIFGQTTYQAMLRPGGHLHVDVRMPVTPMGPATPEYGRIARASFNAYLRKTIAAWARLQRGAMRIDVPEPKVADTYYASLDNILLPRYRLGGDGAWVQAVNLERYHSFYLRDAALMNHALDVVGLHRQAGQNLPFFLTWQDPSGLFISRPGQLDGFGQALWAFGDHLQRTGDTSFARRAYPAIQRAMAWFESARATDPLRIMPVGNPGDNEYVQGHIVGDDFWAYAGVEQAVALAQRLGHDADARRWSADLADFQRALRTAVRASAARLGGFIPPALEGGGQDWGNYWAAYPAQAFAPTDPLVTATIAHERRESREGIATYGAPRLLHAYLGFRVLETELERNQQADVVQGLYSELAHTTSTGASFETGTPPLGNRAVDTATVPHGWWAAEYVTLLRNMLVREQGRGVVLMSALPPAWLAPGRVVAVRAAPTEFGTVSFSLRGTADGATLSWRSSLARGTALSWPLPAGVRDVHARGLSRRVIHLHGRSGSLSILWRPAGGPRPTFAKVAAALLAQYRRHGAASRAAAGNAVPLVSDPNAGN